MTAEILERARQAWLRAQQRHDEAKRARIVAQEEERQALAEYVAARRALEAASAAEQDRLAVRS